MQKKFANKKKVSIFVVEIREHSSAGLEHLPYKQGVIGSNPIVPTRLSRDWQPFFVIDLFKLLLLELIFVRMLFFNYICLIIALCDENNKIIFII